MHFACQRDGYINIKIWILIKKIYLKYLNNRYEFNFTYKIKTFKMSIGIRRAVFNKNL